MPVKIQKKMWKLVGFYLLGCFQYIQCYSEDIKGPPIAQQKEMKKIVRLGEDVKIQCPISGNPTPIIEWKRGGETIDYSFIRFRTKGRQLRIKKTQEDDTGVYICKGVNGFGNIEVRVDLIVIDPAKFPDLKDGELPDVTAPVFTKDTLDFKQYTSKQFGDSYKVSCEAKGNPEPEIFWFKDGVPFDADGIKYRNGKSTIKMRNIMEGDGAVYTCKAKNLVGSVTRNFTLNVEVPYSEQQPVVSGSGNMTVLVGDTASLQCRVKSTAPPHIKWLKKQNPDAPSDMFTINVGDDRYRVIHTGEDIPIAGEGYLNKLVIHNAQEQDSGLYICFVTNSAGSFNYKPSYLRVYPNNNNVERQDSFPGTTGESTSILVLVISLGIIVVLILIFIIACVVKKNSKASHTPDSPEVVRNLMAPSRSTQSSSTITTVASNKFDQPLPPPPSIWTSTMHKSNTAELFNRDFSSLHENSSQNLLSDRESPVSVGGNQYEVPYCYGTQDILHDTRYNIRPINTINTGISDQHTGHYPFRHYPYFQYLNDYDSY